MREQFHLPPELTEIEAKLRQASLPASRINREALFYGAGWAAAEAQCAQRTSQGTWPLASGVLAATVVILAILLAKSPSQQLEVAQAPSSLQSEADAPVLHPVYVPAVVKSWGASAPLLEMRDLALRGELTDRPVVSLTGGPAAEPTTAWELMQELLPNARRIDAARAPFRAGPRQRVHGRETI